MNIWIAKLIDNQPVAPVSCIAPGVSPQRAAEVMNFGTEGVDWRIVTEEERIELQKPTPSELTADFNNRIQQRLDAFAKEKDYDNINAARLASFGAFQEDGVKANAAYDATWNYAISYLFDSVAAGIITVEQAVNELPTLSWN